MPPDHPAGAPDIWSLLIQDSRDVNNCARWRRKHPGFCDAKTWRHRPINQSGAKTFPDDLGSRWFSHHAFDWRADRKGF
jgi:hypothetical protein